MASETGLKYYAEFKNTRGHQYMIEVYERDYLGAAKIMGDLCGCALEVQGNMGSIISPIVKTQLRFSLVDSYDKEDTQTTKYGDWQEFFTPNDRLYRVVLSRINPNTGNYVREWSGYITPDSWQESLDYRGAITITARDGIGHLKDFPFEPTGDATPDENGLVQIYNLFLEAQAQIAMPMTVHVEAPGPLQYSADVPETEDGYHLDEAYVNVALFEGMNWYDVLEQTLESIGFCMRYVGGNEMIIGCLRNQPKLGHYTEETGYQVLEFYGGTLELDPAVKRIEEEQDYKQQNEVGLEHMKGLTFDATTTYRCKTDGNTMPGGGTFSIPEHDADKNDLAGAGQTGWDVGSGMLDPSLYLPDDFVRRAEGEDGWRNYAFIASNQVLNGSAPSATFRFRTKTSAVKLTFRFTPNPMTIEYQGSSAGKMDGTAHYALAEIKYYLCYSDGTTTRWWTGGQWQNSAYLITKEYDSQNKYETDFVVELAECADIEGGLITIMFGQITYKMWSSGGHGCYARVAEIMTEINGTTALKSNKITTINNDNYNVLLTRKPLFGALSREMGFVKPANYLAGMFYYPVYGGDPELFPYELGFTDFGGHDIVPLPVLIHQQILCYYFGAARVLYGSCAPQLRYAFEFGRTCRYKGHEYLLQGGTLDLFSGIMGGATFREYLDYRDLWDGEAPTYDEETIYNS